MNTDIFEQLHGKRAQVEGTPQWYARHVMKADRAARCARVEHNTRLQKTFEARSQQWLDRAQQAGILEQVLDVRTSVCRRRVLALAYRATDGVNVIERENLTHETARKQIGNLLAAGYRVEYVREEDRG